MKKYRNIVILILSVISTLISIIAICRVCPNTSELGLDYQGIIVGILALLVTALIGWQIYISINVKEELKEILVFRKEISNKINEKYSELDYQTSIELSQVIQMLFAMQTKDIVATMPVLFSVYYSCKNSSGIVAKKAASLFIRNYIEAFYSVAEKEQDAIISEIAVKTKYEYVQYFLLNDVSLPRASEEYSEYHLYFSFCISLLQEIEGLCDMEHQSK